MSIGTLVGRLASRNIHIGSDRSELVIDAPDGALTDDLIEEIRDNKNALLVWLAENARSRGDSRPPLTRLERGDSIPLSFAQQRLWYLDLLDPGHATYNMPFAYRISGRLQTELLEKSLNAVVQRHEALRTTFGNRDGSPCQDVKPELHIGIEMFEGSRKPLSDAELEEVLIPLAVRPFDLQAGPLLRAAVLSTGPEQWVFIVIFHHAIFDGKSLGVFEHDIAAFYSALLENTTPTLPELAVQFPDFARWQTDWLNGDTLARYLDHWLPQFKDKDPAIFLPTDHPYPTKQTYHGARVVESVAPEPIRQLRALAVQQRATLFNVLMTAFFAVLWRVSRQNDVTIGFSLANREPIETEGMIGLFVNTLPLRLQVEEGTTFARLLAEVRSRTIDAITYADLPFEKLVEELNPARDMARAPIFQVLLSYLDGVQQKFEVGDLAFRRLRVPLPVARMDLTLFVTEGEDSLEMVLEYNSDVFEAVSAGRLLNMLTDVLAGAVHDPEAPLRALTQVSPELRGTILGAWNDTDAELPGPKRLDRLVFSRDSADGPGAIVFEDQETDGVQLQREVERIAARLSLRQVRNDEAVGVLLNRSPTMLAAMLAVLRAGGAYVPLDPSFPPERLAFMLSDSRARLLITDTSLQNSAPEFDGEIICIDEEDSLLPADTVPDTGTADSPDDLAYYLYTSGSTGKPKGVMVTHGNVCNFLSSMARVPGLHRDDTLVAVTTTSFDISVLELYLPLMTGARLVIASSEDASRGDRLMQLLEQHNATVMQATPSTWRMLIEAGWRGNSEFKALCGGEPLPPGLARQLLERCGEVWNLYGPTETTVWSSCGRVEDADAPITIGRPIANTRIYILDEQLNPMPPGVPGEICIGGAGVARGYHRRDELTGQKFIPDPFAAHGGSRLYRTGDLGRWRSDGSLQHLGRLDNQVKIRGYRIELGEIERVLALHESVAAAACKVWEPQPGDQRLNAFIVCRDGYTLAPTEIRKHLRKYLPDYMVPQALQPIDALPLTPNNKLDRKALPDPVHEKREAREREEPDTPEERAIADIWKEVIGVEQVGRRDNFFELGGHSLLAVRAAVAMEKKLGCPVELRHIILEDLSQLAGRFPFSSIADDAKRADKGGLLARLRRS